MTPEGSPGMLTSISSELAGVVEQVAPSVVRVDDGSRLTATGIIWAADGLIATTSHGVERDENLAVELGDGTGHSAALVGRDPDTDLAVIRLTEAPKESITVVPLGDSDKLEVGQKVLAIGNPFATQSRAKLLSICKTLSRVKRIALRTRNAGRMFGHSLHGQHPQ